VVDNCSSIVAKNWRDAHCGATGIVNGDGEAHRGQIALGVSYTLVVGFGVGEAETMALGIQMIAHSDVSS
jgi:hypothetical protein